MIDIEAVMADFAVRQAERQTRVVEEIQQLKTVILPRVQQAGIARVEPFAQGACGGGIHEVAVIVLDISSTGMSRWSGTNPSWATMLKARLSIWHGTEMPPKASTPSTTSSTDSVVGADKSAVSSVISPVRGEQIHCLPNISGMFLPVALWGATISSHSCMADKSGSNVNR